MTMRVLEIAGPVDDELPEEASGQISDDVVARALKAEADVFARASKRQAARRRQLVAMRKRK